jgi:hypothetical protein
MNSFNKKKYDKVHHRNYYAKDLNENYRKKTGAFKKRRNELVEEAYDQEIKEYTKER